MRELAPETAYHDRQFLNPIGRFASSQITAFCGSHPYRGEDGELKPNTLTELIISDCYNSVHIHLAACETLEAYTAKIRLIAETCGRFADYLEGSKS